MEINTKEIDLKNTSMLDKANALIVNDDEGLIVAGKFLTGIKTHVKNIKATFKDSKAATDLAHTKVCDLEKKALGFTADAEICIKDKMSDYTTKQEAIEKARAAKLAAELKAKAEKDALDLAMNLETNGQNAEAAMVLEVAAAPVHVAPVKAVKVAGISYKDVTKFEIETDDLLPRNCTSGDKKKIKAQIDAGVKVIPGVKIWTKKEVSARA